MSMRKTINGNVASILKILGFVLIVISFAAGAVAYVHGMASDLRTEREARIANLASKDSMVALADDIATLREEHRDFRKEMRDDLRLIAAKIDSLASPK